MKQPHAVVIGAGAGGLAAAIDLARQGLQVTVFDAASHPGGKMRQITVGDRGIDAGPTVFTMRWVFEQLFQDAGSRFEPAVSAVPAKIMARHAWTTGGNLDLHDDIALSAAAIARFSSADDLAGFRRFSGDAEDMLLTLQQTFMAAQKPSPLELVQRIGWKNLPLLLATRPHQTLWHALGDYFDDPRLRQLFGRYATYVGSSPLASPATLMLIAHVEQEGVWQLSGGMRSLAESMLQLGESLGVRYRLGEPVQEIQVAGKRVSGVRSGEEVIAADIVVFNGDYAALSQGHLGNAVRQSVPRVKPSQRGLSALTWCVVANTSGFELDYHNVFFDEDYPREFQRIFTDRDLPAMPTVYVCAQDRFDGARPDGTERLLLLINAPADGDRVAWTEQETREARNRALNILARCGLHLEFPETHCVATTPSDFNQLFPASGGSLYGRASHGMWSSFTRPGSRTRLGGLYLAGGTVHPGPGVPMSTLSGRLAADAALADLAARGVGWVPQSA